MKKTLIALAAVAVTTGAMAQATISGKFGYTYQANTDAAGVKSTGMAVSDGDVNFSASEDLGAGLKASVFMGIRLRGREVNSDGATDGIGARDSTLTLTGGFGSLTVGSVAAGSGIASRGTAGAPGEGLDDNGEILDAEVNGVDLLQYTTPSFGGASVYVQVVDSIGNPGAGGTETTSTVLSANAIGVNYSAGPISASVDTTSYSAHAAAVTTAAYGQAEDRVRLSASYDLGVAKVGFGMQTKGYVLAENTQTVYGVSVPMGALTLGVAYGKNSTKIKATGLSTDNTGINWGANYALSKRTNVQLSYRVIDTAASTTDTKSTRVRLMHSF
jgi:hypothetical protein